MSVMHSLVSQVLQQRGNKDSDEKEGAAPNEDDTNEDKKVVANRANAGVAGVGKDEEEMGKDEDEEVVANGANAGVARDGKDEEEMEKDEAKDSENHDSERTNENPTFAVGEEVNNNKMNQ